MHSLTSFHPLALCALMFSLIFSFNVSAESKDTKWELEKSKKSIGLNIYTRYIKGSDLKAFKAEVTVKQPIGAVFSVLADHDNSCNWIANCAEYQMFEQSEGANYSYMVNEAPWPVSNRDAIVRSVVSQNQETFEVMITLEGKPKYLPKTEDNIRIPKMDGFWKLIPVDEDTTTIVYQVHANPGGGLPTWLSNSVVVDTPYDTMRGLLKQLKKEKYDHVSHPDVKNYVAQVQVEPAMETTSEESSEIVVEENSKQK